MQADARRLARAALLAVLVLAALALPAGALAATVAVSPLNGTPDASPWTQISFLGVPPDEIVDVAVVGSRTGRHWGKLKGYISSPGASFVPEKPFSEGERVTASAVVGPRGHGTAVRTTFTVATLPGYPRKEPNPLSIIKPGLSQAFHSQPRLKPPSVWVKGAPPLGRDILLTPTHGYGQSGAMITDALGRVLWFHPSPRGEEANNLQVQSYRGRPVLTWWQGRVATNLGVGFGTDEIFDSSYHLVANVHAGNGYEADLHEFHLEPSGAAFLTAYSLVDADLSSVGSFRNGILQDAIVQEVDVPTGLVMFEWHAYGHVGLQDSYAPPFHYINYAWDFFHVNSISPDTWGDGNFIVSSRNTWAAYEIDHVTGQVLWRLGGKSPSFRMGPGTGTAWQHDVRWQPDRTLTIFDNGATPKAHSESRVIRERIDWAHRTVKLISRYSNHVLSGSQGDDQALPEGGSFVGWGESPDMTLFAPEGQVLFNAGVPYPGESYRAYLVPWNGAPTTQPALAVSGGTAYASWNGATGVASWRLLAGPSGSSMQAVQTVPWSGFETAIPLAGAGPSVAVQALGAEGQVLATSPVSAG